MKQLVSSFGISVRQLREQQGWSQEALAERADLNRSYVGELERGQAIPSLLTLKKLALALDLSLTNLIAHAERIEQTRLVRGIQLTAIAC
ncbi:MAG: helix-turn-helix transcriptional regulator [Pseudomonadota bacterium]